MKKTPSYLKTRALLAYLGPAVDPKDTSDEEASRAALKAGFGSPSTEHIHLSECEAWTGADGKEVLTPLSEGEFYFYDVVAKTRGDAAPVRSATVAEAIASPVRPSPLKMMWHTEKICATLRGTKITRP